MARRKDASSSAKTRRVYPYRIELSAAEARRLSWTLDLRTFLHGAKTAAPRKLLERHDSQSFVVYCFFDADEADRFHTTFGGRRFDVASEDIGNERASSRAGDNRNDE